ncbi:TRAP transporter small permease subunit [Lentibacter sp. XHP0401]|uniref:TRAP transporter small permease subunit n=1 Tax=Lentibacter sp. XHP0401 TaxID=2984334 RepID=UPI0021E95ACD|nr:TRAP transporter small permease subunit [Lentibacter sp. XHP0401]MCV2892624.1 TRAP transporter small permease subunit [Lentibacter sp. XHP0401]
MTRFLASYAAFTSRLSAFAAQLGMVAIVLMAVHILIEITLRAFWSTSTFILDEFVGYEVAAMTFLGLGAALDDKVLLRVNLLLLPLKGWLRVAVELFNALATLAVFSFLTFHLIRQTIRSFERKTTSLSILETPLWIPQSILVLGLVIFCIQLTGLMAKALHVPEDLD